MRSIDGFGLMPFNSYHMVSTATMDRIHLEAHPPRLNVVGGRPFPSESLNKSNPPHKDMSTVIDEEIERNGLYTEDRVTPIRAKEIISILEQKQLR